MLRNNTILHCVRNLPPYDSSYYVIIYFVCLTVRYSMSDIYQILVFLLDDDYSSVASKFKRRFILHLRWNWFEIFTCVFCNLRMSQLTIVTRRKILRSFTTRKTKDEAILSTFFETDRLSQCAVNKGSSKSTSLLPVEPASSVIYEFVERNLVSLSEVTLLLVARRIFSVMRQIQIPNHIDRLVRVVTCKFWFSSACFCVYNFIFVHRNSLRLLRRATKG